MAVKVIRTGIFVDHGEKDELDSHGHTTGKKVQDSAVVATDVVRLDELMSMLSQHRKVAQAQGFHERVDTIDSIVKEIRA